METEQLCFGDRVIVLHKVEKFNHPPCWICAATEQKYNTDPTASFRWGLHYIHELNGLFMLIALPVNEAKQSSEEYRPFKV